MSILGEYAHIDIHIALGSLVSPCLQFEEPTTIGDDNDLAGALGSHLS